MVVREITARDFTYNRASQVESVSTSNHNLVYQGNHNLTGTWQANGLNQISNIAGQAYTWDGNANLESDGPITRTPNNITNISQRFKMFARFLDGKSLWDAKFY